jgi:hypothetical protein
LWAQADLQERFRLQQEKHAADEREILALSNLLADAKTNQLAAEDAMCAVQVRKRQTAEREKISRKLTAIFVGRSKRIATAASWHCCVRQDQRAMRSCVRSFARAKFVGHTVYFAMTDAHAGVGVVGESRGRNCSLESRAASPA